MTISIARAKSQHAREMTFNRRDQPTRMVDDLAKFRKARKLSLTRVDIAEAFR